MGFKEILNGGPGDEAPDINGARATRWLDEQTLQTEELAKFYQSRDYKIFPESVLTKQESLINSVVAYHPQEETVSLGKHLMVEVKGYAVPVGYDGPVELVEVSGAGVVTWVEADFVGRRTTFSWAIWMARLRLERGKKRTNWSRATSAGENVQPRLSAWNGRGVGYNGYRDARYLTVSCV
ncbi:uncharacterized protein RAG0_08746 [Rhynchosporium agropyri]|uniref:Moybdenum cofactor oxidoreductase dimerisation domain-containing protein n=1 Tax=Rhynchosporium agropyri TaxID=914238 RepID=A0A1E1KS95_9HELO|nr:uncharacterized protein RAG0_08746 [Rhynchosporium agropyri]